MLGAVGIDYRFVAVSSLGYAPATVRVTGRYPVNFFGGVLVYLPSDDCYLNDTGEYAELGAVNADGMIGLDLATGRLLAVRPRGGVERGVSTVWNIRIAADGSAEATRRSTYTGNSFESAKRRFAEMLPAERKQYFESLAAGIAESAEIVGEPETDFSRFPGTMTIRLHIPGFAAKSGEFLQFELPEFDRYAAMVRTADSARKTPYWRNHPSRLAMEYRIGPPPGYRPADARPARIELGRFGSAGYYEYRSFADGTLRIDTGLALPVELVRPVGYPELAAMQKELSKPAAGWVILRYDAAANPGGK